jgi:regulator of replication initiation timing
MDSTHLLPAVFLVIVGTMYVVLVAFTIPSLKRLDKNGEGIRKVLVHFTALSVTTFFDIAYNTYILYIMNGGKPVSQLHILAKLFPSQSYFHWVWTFSTISIAYILFFSCGLLYMVVLTLSSIKVDELEAQWEENEGDILELQENREQELSELEAKNTFLKQLKAEFSTEFEEARAEIREKAKTIIQKEQMIRSGTVSTEIREMLNPEIKLSHPEESPFEEYITRAEKIEDVEGLPEDLLQTIREYRVCLESIDEKFRDFIMEYNDAKWEKGAIFEALEKLDTDLEELEEENEGLEKQLKVLGGALQIALLTDKINSVLDKSSGKQPEGKRDEKARPSQARGVYRGIAGFCEPLKKRYIDLLKQ